MRHPFCGGSGFVRSAITIQSGDLDFCIYKKNSKIVQRNVDNVTDVSDGHPIFLNASVGSGNSTGKDSGQFGRPRTWHITASYYF
ncbi:hypothetical protein FAI41_04965 [Acetobacteraceae bacterium]|nr:hypothetical protein FAI41_04965 [Acetobacteraceae bacterium]